MLFACLSGDFFRPVNRKVASGKRGCRNFLRLLGTGTRCAADYAATKNLREHQLRRGARARDGSRSSWKGSSARTTPAGWPTKSRRAPPILLVALRIRIESAHSLELTPFWQARSASASSSSTSNSSSATANSAERNVGVKRRRKGPGSASSPSVASAQGRLRQRPEMVSSLIYFFPAPPARFCGSSARASGLLHSHTLYSSCY
jgi:hypothetical protein